MMRCAAFLGILVVGGCAQAPAFEPVPMTPVDFAETWSETGERVWLGPSFWANPLQEWRLKDGRIECITAARNRSVHLLTRRLGEKPGAFTLSVTIGRSDGADLAAGRGAAGFGVGIQGPLKEYRNSLIKGSGLNACITTAGGLTLGAPEPEKKGNIDLSRKTVELRLQAAPVGERYTLTLTAHDASTGAELGKFVRKDVPASRLMGNVALVSNPGPARGGRGATARFAFAGWKVGGAKVEAHPDRVFGPILFSQHSLSRGVMKMTAQMPPIGKGDAQRVRLETHTDGAWKKIAEAKIHPLARTATFRVENWEDTRNVPYRLVYRFRGRDHTWTGTVRRDPVDRDTIVVAGFTGNTDQAFPNHLLAENVRKANPDVMVFTGDQLYESVAGFGIKREPLEVATLDYLRKWYVFGWAFRDLMRDRVSLCLPDDHDVYQGNIWGQSGRGVPSMREHAQGGYAMDPLWVNAVQRTQTRHHPDPYDPTPVDQGITVYYGDMVYGGISFAFIEDRKFKSGPEGKVISGSRRPDHVKDRNFDPKTVDKPGLKLLGDRQLKFLREWAADWRGAEMKIVCSQTVFANVANYHGGNKEFLVADLDSNGWPQTGRNKALHEMRRGFAFHLAGDQHLASIVHHGIDTWRDAGWSFCVPSIAAGYPRSWHPEREGKGGKNRAPGMPPYAGDFLDGLGNHICVVAVGNPAEQNRRPVLELLHDKASGFGVVRLNKAKREITMECWRLLVDLDNPKPGDQFPGWPRTIRQVDNYGRKAVAYLPELRISRMNDPVVQVIAESDGEVVYTLRIKGTRFRPKVFAEGTYTVKVGELGTDRVKTLRGVKALPPDRKETLEVRVPGDRY